MLVENFRGHIWNQANLLITIPEFEKDTFDHHPSTETIRCSRFQKRLIYLEFLKTGVSFPNYK